MRYPPELVERLAAEYVLGTMRGGARRRMEALMRDRADARLAVWRWERSLDELTRGVAPQRPPKSVWRGIGRRLAADRHRPRASRGWPRLLLAAAAAAAFAFWLGTLMPPAPQPDRIAVFADDAAQALWIVSADRQARKLVAEATGVAAAVDDQAYELWALPQGAAPRSLGLLQVAAGRYETSIDPESIAAIENSAGLAISLEPSGGSPTGLPTGPIVYQAALVRL